MILENSIKTLLNAYIPRVGKKIIRLFSFSKDVFINDLYTKELH